jgi:hypothetical protein
MATNPARQCTIIRRQSAFSRRSFRMVNPMIGISKFTALVAVSILIRQTRICGS